MTQTYTSVFGSETIPPSRNAYSAVALTADTTFYWPELASGSNLMADIMEVTPTAAYAMTFPAANGVSTGRDVLVRNLGAYTITLKDNSGGTIGTVAAGVAKYVYLTSNATIAGAWTIFTFGTGTSAADAATLAGYGLTATGSTLSQSTSTVSSSISTTLDATDRSSLRIFSASGAVTCSLPTAVGLGNGWFACVSNQGTGTVTIDPNSTETIDGALTKDLAPGESTYIVTDGANWVTVGYGRSTQFQFTKLVYPIAVGTPFTLTSTQAGNKLLEFTGILAAAATVNVPAVVAIYYVECSYTGAYALTIKTAAGTGVNLNAGDRSILYCDGTNVTSAQTASVAVSNISGGVAGALPYQTGVGLTGFSAAGTSGQILLSGGTGTPTWSSGTGTGVPVRATGPTLTGLTVSGAAFTSRGITDNATATALTLSGSGANSITIANSATNPTIGTSGGNLAISNTIVIGSGATLSLYATGTGNLQFGSQAGQAQFRINGAVGNVAQNGIGLISGAAGSAVSFLATDIGGTGDTNISFGIFSRGSGQVSIGTAAGTPQFAIVHNATAVNYFTVNGGVAGNVPVLTTAGADSDVTAYFSTKGNGDIFFSPGGTGNVKFGTYSAKGAEAFAGFITIKDAAGNSRKIMVCA